MNELFKELKLYYMDSYYDDFVKSFKAKAPVANEVLQKMAHLELEERKKRNIERRIRESRVGQMKPMKDFDWQWPKKIDRPRVESLLDLKFIDEKQNIILIGAEGVGKTMIGKNLAHLAAAKGKSSLFTSASELAVDLTAAYSAGVFRSRLKRYLRPALLVIDEIGYLSFDNKAADLLFDVVSKRYEKSAIVITTNLGFSEWTKVFPGAACITALIDRLTHHCEILEIDADSYRLKESKQHQREKKNANKPKN